MKKYLVTFFFILTICFVNSLGTTSLHADEAAGKKHALQERDLCPHQHPGQQHDRQKTEMDHGIKRKRRLHSAPPDFGKLALT